MGKILINADPYLIFYEYFQIRNAFFQDKVLDELKVDDRCTIDLGDFKTFVKIIKAYSIYNEIYFNSDINKVITMFFSLPTQMIIFDGQNFMDNYQDYLEYYKEMPIIIKDLINKTKDTYVTYNLIFHKFFDFASEHGNDRDKYQKIYELMHHVQRITIADAISSHYNGSSHMFIPSENKELIGRAYYKSRTPRFSSLYQR